MKQILLLAIAAMTFASCQQNTAKTTQLSAGADTTATEQAAPATAVDVANAPVMTFVNETHDFGTIAKGEKVHYDYKFTNTGKTPLIITGAQASCGCTIPETPKDPIQPGKEGVIKVIFDSTGKSGKQDKVITVSSSNANPLTVGLHLKGEIK